MGLLSSFKKKKTKKAFNDQEPIIERTGPNHYTIHATEIDEETYRDMKKDYDQFIELYLKAVSNKVEIKKNDLIAGIEKISNNGNAK